MATLKSYPLVNHYAGGAGDFVVHTSNGKTRHSGTAQAFWFRPIAASISEVPITDQEQPVLFHGITADQQDVTVQLNVTYRFADPLRVLSRLNFTILPESDEMDGRSQVASIIGQLVQHLSLGYLAKRSLAEVLRDGLTDLHQVLSEQLGADARLSDSGIEVLGLQILAIRPDSDVERALQTPMREQLQAEADKATYERRALAVERERAIAENELANKIELETRREQLVAQAGANARREAEEEAAAESIKSQAAAERSKLQTATIAEGTRVQGEADADAIRARQAALATADPEIMKIQALETLAGSLPEIGQIVLTPDMLSAVLSGLLGKKEERNEDGATTESSYRLAEK